VDYIYDRAKAVPHQFGEELLSAYAQNFPDAPTRASQKARKFVEAVLSWLEAHPLPAEETQTRHGEWIASIVGDALVPAPTNELRDLILALDQIIEPETTLQRFLGQIGPLGRDRAFAQSQGIRIMTMASAKGLTVRATIVAALEDGIIPRPDVTLSEEHRLLYVAMTRAQDFLFGTWARRRRGPTARSGTPRVAEARRHSHFLDGGPVHSQDGADYIQSRWH
jgi:superfamily I DNA/RNA helicase